MPSATNRPLAPGGPSARAAFRRAGTTPERGAKALALALPTENIETKPRAGVGRRGAYVWKKAPDGKIAYQQIGSEACGRT
jgi:hypothetical protein